MPMDTTVLSFYLVFVTCTYHPMPERSALLLSTATFVINTTYQVVVFMESGAFWGFSIRQVFI